MALHVSEIVKTEYL